VDKTTTRNRARPPKILSLNDLDLRTNAEKKIYALLRELEEERGSTSVWRTRDLMAGIMAEDLKARWFEGEPSYTPWLDPLGSAVLLRALPTVSSDGRLSSMT
jgi:hypothetical protein